MMVGLMEVAVYEHLVVEGVLLLELWKFRDLALQVLGEGRPKGEVVHDVGQVRHRRVQIVELGPRFDVEVPGDAIHEDVARDHAAGMFLDVEHALLSAGVPVLHGLLELDLLLEEVHEGVHRTVLLVVDAVLLPVLEEAQRRERHDPLRRAELPIGDAVHLDHVHVDRRTARTAGALVQLLDFLREGLPGRFEALAPDAPRGEEVDEDVRVFL
mmetsp:Transcript_14182/g.46297  ORF Transcript_14182/g.46297 Transcript_14182/m.46297 type:complete len:213 (-) Transcript_14182:784-1422(-)